MRFWALLVRWAGEGLSKRAWLAGRAGGQASTNMPLKNHLKPTNYRLPSHPKLGSIAHAANGAEHLTAGGGMVGIKTRRYCHSIAGRSIIRLLGSKIAAAPTAKPHYQPSAQVCLPIEHQGLVSVFAGEYPAGRVWLKRLLKASFA